MKSLFISLISILVIYSSCSDANASLSISSHEKISIKKETSILPKVRCYNKALIPKIDSVIFALKNNDIDYNWYDYTSCNVGLFAQLCSNTSKSELKKKVASEYSDFIEDSKKHIDDGTIMSWRKMSNYYCGITGKKVSGIIGDLQNAGFTAADISHLEYLNDPYICLKTDLDKSSAVYWTQKENLIKYLEVWREIIKNQ